jgi:hypothetical protein
MLGLNIRGLNPQGISRIFHFAMEIWLKIREISKMKMDKTAAQCFWSFFDSLVHRVKRGREFDFIFSSDE